MKTITAKYPGTCARTGKPIKRGDLINFYGRGHAELATSGAGSAARRQNEAMEEWVEDPEQYQEDEANGLKNQPGTRRDKSSAEDSCCGDLAYEDRCAELCGPGL